ncbi:MAG: homocysteine S-methyltransferase family protein [Aggregatilineales bacterium]
MRFDELLQASSLIVADGGMGTMLFTLGLAQGAAPERWNLDQPEHIRSVHRGYIEAGAQIILTNTFGGNRLRLARHGLDARCAEINAAAARLARAEVDAAAHPVVVAGSIGPTGEFFAPMGVLTPQDAQAAFAEQATALAEGGVDVFWIETMSDLQEVEAAAAACRQAAPDLPVVTTMTFDTKGRTMMGVRPEQAAAAMVELGVAAGGANCGNGPQEIEEVIVKMHAAQPDLVLVAKSNAGRPRLEGRRAVYDATPADMAAYAQRVRAAGARIVGACCGSTPAHIAAIAGALQTEGA